MRIHVVLVLLFANACVAPVRYSTARSTRGPRAVTGPVPGVDGQDVAQDGVGGELPAPSPEVRETPVNGTKDEEQTLTRELLARLEEFDAEEAHVWWDLEMGYVVANNAVRDASGGKNEVSAAVVQLKAYPSRLSQEKRSNDERDFYAKLLSWDRAFASFGLSVGGTNGDGGVDSNGDENGVVTSPLFTFGLGYDFVPELGLVVGVAIFEEEEIDGDPDVNFAPFAGLTVDLSILAKIFGK